MISSKSYGLQNETRQYLRRLYAYGRELAPTDVNDIDNFVKGLKQLNLWNKTLCWPMRSIHNIGYGSTVLSLGGSSPVNGTMINSPAWGSNGIIFTTATNTHITTPLDVKNLKRFTTMVATEQTSQVGAADSLISAWGSTSQTQYFILRKTATTFINGIVRSSGATRSTSTSSQSPNWRVYGWGTQFNNTILTTSGIQTNSQAFLPDETGSQTLNIGILALPNNSPYNGTIAWVFFTKDVDISNNDQLLLYSLYKSTIGKGLGLP